MAQENNMIAPESLSPQQADQLLLVLADIAFATPESADKQGRLRILGGILNPEQTKQFKARAIELQVPLQELKKFHHGPANDPEGEKFGIMVDTMALGSIAFGSIDQARQRNI